MTGWDSTDTPRQGWDRQYRPATAVLDPQVRCLMTGDLYPLGQACNPQDCLTICGTTTAVRPIRSTWPAPSYQEPEAAS